MKTRNEILSLLVANKASLQRRFKVEKIAVFGSYARGDQGENSDVDILVNVDPSIGLEFVTLAEEMEKILDEHVDLVSSRSVNPRKMRLIERDLIYV